MKIAMIVPSFPVLSETFIARQAQALSATVLTTRLNRTLSVPTSVDIIELPKNKQFFDLFGTAIYGHYRLKYSTGKALTRYIQNNRPDVIMAHFGHTGLKYRFICKKAGVPFLVHFHGNDLSKSLRKDRYKHALSRLLKVDLLCIVVNDIQKKRLIELGGNKNNIRVIPCGVPLAQFPFVEARQENHCRFLYVGRMVEKKSPLNIIRAFALCSKYCPCTTLTMVGDGKLLDEVRSLSQELRVFSKVNFTGALPNPQVRQIMQSSSAFIQHSITASDGSEEGWPNAIAEACATGLPIVATRHAAIPSQVLDGKTGYLVEENDWEGMAERMVKLASDFDLRRRFGWMARKHIEKVGNFEIQLNKLRSFLEFAIKYWPAPLPEIKS